MTSKIVVSIAVVLALGIGTVYGQTPVDSDITPTADQMRFVGVVPAAPGSDVRLEVLDVASAKPIVCAEGTTFATEIGDASTSGFSLILERSCLQPGYENVRVCWSGDQCDLVQLLSSATFAGGTTVETGLLDASVEVPTVLPEADIPTSALPRTGTGFDSGSHRWLLWLGLASLGSALALSAGYGLIRRNSG